MIVNDKDAAARLSSPMNLINRMKNLSAPRKSAMSLFIRPTIDITAAGDDDKAKVTFNPLKDNKTQDSSAVEIVEEVRTTIDDISSDHDSKIALGLAHDNAIKLLNSSVSALSAKLDDVKADKLPAVIAAASKTIESIRRERNEAQKNSKDREVHYHFYTPQQKKLSDYAVVEVSQ
jgi:hypothetical protein